MIHNSKNRYRELADERLPIFHQPFWLDAVCGNNWDVAMLENANSIIASLPYTTIKKPLGLYSTMPSFTQFLGPFLNLPDAKYSNYLSSEMNVLNELIKSLPAFSYFEQNWNYEVQNWLPFHWQGYKQTSKFTYVLNNIKDYELLWGNMRENIRREIRKAEKNEIKILSGLPFKNLIEIIQKIADSRKFKMNHGILKSIFDSCEKNDCSLCNYAQNRSGNILSVVFVVWDQKKAYYIIGGKNPDFENKGSASLLFWETIKMVSGKVDVFDFEGSMIQSIEKYFRGFGSAQMQYNVIYKSGRKWQERLRNLK